jgi:hypothetical protein
VDGTLVTCTIVGSTLMERGTGDPTFDAGSTLALFGPGFELGGCGRANLWIEATYRDPQGDSKVSRATGGPNSVSLFNNDVTTGYVATHLVTFVDCAQGACQVLLFNRPK